MNKEQEKVFGEEFDRWIDNASSERNSGGYDCLVKTVSSLLSQAEEDFKKNCKCGKM